MRVKALVLQELVGVCGVCLAQAEVVNKRWAAAAHQQHCEQHDDECARQHRVPSRIPHKPRRVHCIIPAPPWHPPHQSLVSQTNCKLMLVRSQADLLDATEDE